MNSLLVIYSTRSFSTRRWLVWRSNVHLELYAANTLMDFDVRRIGDGQDALIYIWNSKTLYFEHIHRSNIYIHAAFKWRVQLGMLNFEFPSEVWLHSVKFITSVLYAAQSDMESFGFQKLEPKAIC